MTPRTSTRTLVNFRLPITLVAEMDRAAQLAGLNRTEWVISTLTVACREGLRQAALAVAAGATGARLPGAPPASSSIDGCPHPRHRRQWNNAGQVCLECGHVVQRTYKGA